MALLGLLVLGGCSSGRATASARQTGAVTASGPGAATVRLLPRSCLKGLSSLQPFAAGPAPRPLSAPLGHEILSRFAIFRREALPRDQPSAHELAGGKLARQLLEEYELASYYPAYVRELVRLPNGPRYYVVPAFARPEAVPSTNCLGRGVDRSALIEQERRRLVEPVYCLVEVGGRNAPTAGCEPFAALDASLRVFGASDFLRTPIVELVPDGVAEVRISYRGNHPVVAPVTENAFAFTPPPAPSSLRRALERLIPRLARPSRIVTLEWDEALRKTDPTRIEWLGRGGHLVRAIAPPAAASVAATSVGGLRAPIGG